MEYKGGKRQPPPFQDILFTLVRVCWHNHPRSHSMDPPPSLPLPLFPDAYTSIHTRSKISFPSDSRRQLLPSSTHYKHPERVSLSPSISSNVAKRVTITDRSSLLTRHPVHASLSGGWSRVNSATCHSSWKNSI